MPETSPLISVTLPAYNNAEQIGEAISSVLNQTWHDFELVIVNDGSTDKTEEVIKTFSDSRIVYIAQENQGASQATNRAIQLARGRYIALFAGDDICNPERLQRQYEFIAQNHNKVVFSRVDFINDAGQAVEGPHFAQSYFNHPNRTRAEMLEWFFFKGNYLCTTSCMVEKSLLLETGLFCVTSAQLPDFDMWLKLIKKYEFYILPENLIKYRVHSAGRNVSSGANLVRNQFELAQVYRNFFDGVDNPLFKAAFAKKIRNPNFLTGPEQKLEAAFLYLQHASPIIRNIGAEKLFYLLQDADILEISKKVYSFGLAELLLLTQSLDINNGIEIIRLREWGLALEADRNRIQLDYNELLKEYRNLEVNYRKLDVEARNAWQLKLDADAAWVSKDQEYLKTLQLVEELNIKLKQQELTVQIMKHSLERFEKDLRKLQSTRTVRLSSWLGRLFKPGGKH